MDDMSTRDQEEELRTAIEAALHNMHVAMPVRVMKGSDGKTVSIQPTIKANQIMPDGTVQQVDYPQLDALVYFTSGGGVTNTHEVKEGDEGMVLLASQSIHNWREMGGVQAQVDSRKHDLSDAIFLPGVRSKPRDLSNISTTSTQTRTDDHQTVSDWSSNGIAHARGEAIHSTTGGGIMSAIKGALHSVTGKGVMASKGGSSHVVVDGAASSLAPKVLLNC
jgi:hypothetical protein